MMPGNRVPLHAIDWMLLPDALWVNIAAHLGVRELGALAGVALRFALPSWEDSGHTGRLTIAERWTVVEEAARRQLMAVPALVRLQAPRDSAQTWLQLFHEALLLAAPVVFNGHSPQVQLSDQRQRASVAGNVKAGCAVSEVCMRAGRHFAEFSCHNGGHEINPRAPLAMAFGVVTDGADESTGGRNWSIPTHSTRYAGGGNQIERFTDVVALKESHMIDTRTGVVFKGATPVGVDNWPGHELLNTPAHGGQGDTHTWGARPTDKLGLLVDLGQGSLALFLNGRYVGQPVDSGIQAPVRWCVSFETLLIGPCLDSTWVVDGPKPPPEHGGR